MSAADADRARLTGATLIAVAAIGFSGKAIIVKLAYRHGLEGSGLRSGEKLGDADERRWAADERGNPI